MKRLLAGDTYKHTGIEWHILKRKGDVCMAVSKVGWSFEVFVVQKAGQRVIAGKNIPPSEYVPNANEWGYKGWTCQTAKRAEKRFQDVACRQETEPASHDS